jgi:hypothetical protein
MNVVIYTKDFEPIISIDLPMWLLNDMERKGGAKLAIPSPDNNTSLTICTLLLKNIKWIDNSDKQVIITLDEEIALMLKPNWLPGQRATINLYQQYIQKLTNKLKDILKRDQGD